MSEPIQDAGDPQLPERYHDLDELFGQWSSEEYERIQAAIQEQRGIDPEEARP